MASIKYSTWEVYPKIREYVFWRLKCSTEPIQLKWYNSFVNIVAHIRYGIFWMFMFLFEIYQAPFESIRMHLNFHVWDRSNCQLTLFIAWTTSNMQIKRRKKNETEKKIRKNPPTQTQSHIRLRIVRISSIYSKKMANVFVVRAIELM